jgi:site-specific DNA-methyltransferase (adenine-specific)
MSLKDEPVTLQQLNSVFEDQPASTIRGRIYDNLGKLFKRVGKGVYIAINPKNNKKALVVQGDGRKLDEIPNEYIDAIITDHPWADKKSNKGGNRHFDGDYADTSFQYTLEDFQEKARVLKDGGFLVENLPEENANNFHYLYQLKCMAEEAGFKYFAQVPWKKGNFVANTGRKAKNIEVLLFMTKGEPRKLKADKQRGLDENGNPTLKMKGTREMLPICFDYQPASRKEKRHKAEKPVELLEHIIDMITEPNELILDQFAGSLNIVLAALNKDRNCIAYEMNEEFVEENMKVIEAKLAEIEGDED